MADDVVPDGQRDHPALADPAMRAVIDDPDPGPASLPRITLLAAELVARHTGVVDQPAVAEALDTLRSGTATRPALAGELGALADEYRQGWRAAPQPVEIGDTPTAAELLHHRMNAVKAIAGALDPDPAKAAWNVCWTAGYAVGRDFGDQLRLAVLDRCRQRAAG